MLRAASYPRLFRLAAAILACLSVGWGAAVLAMPARAAELPALDGKEQVYLYNFDYDVEILHSDFADADANEYLFYPASTVKLMTGLVACEELGGDLDRKINITYQMLEGVTGNNMGLKVGETVSVRDLLYGLLANCANDAANVLAFEIAGGIPAFLDLMNEKARVLGMFHTTYKNPTGMHDDLMRTSLRDTVALAKACYANELLREIAGTRKYVMEETNKTGFRNLYSRNWLISSYYNTSGVHYEYEGITGLNSGYTPNGGYCSVTTATRNGLSYLAVVMGGKENKDGTVTSYELTRSLLDYAFAAYERREVLADGTVIDELPVTLSSTVDFVKLEVSLPDGGIFAYLPTDIDFDEAITLSWYTKEESLRAPVQKGTIVGAVTVRYNGEAIGTADLVTAADVERSDFLYFLSRIKSFTGTKFFLVAIASFVVLFIVYLVCAAKRDERAARHKHAVTTPVKISMPGRGRGSLPKKKAPVKQPPPGRHPNEPPRRPAQPGNKAPRPAPRPPQSGTAPRAVRRVRPDDAIPMQPPRRTTTEKSPREPRKRPPQR